MNYGRLAAAAVAATVADAVYGLVVYGMLLRTEFGRYPNVYRPDDAAPAYLPYMFLGILGAMFVVAYIYAKGYEGGSGVAEGLRFGVVVGIFGAAYVGGVDYGTLNIGRKLTLMIAAAQLGEWTINGTVIGLVYKSSVGARKSAAAV